jgi:hypothetical protein
MVTAHCTACLDDSGKLMVHSIVLGITLRIKVSFTLQTYWYFKAKNAILINAKYDFCQDLNEYNFAILWM